MTNSEAKAMNLSEFVTALFDEFDFECVVRCKDCKRNKTKRCPIFWMGESPDDDGYCFMGERGDTDE